jgi:hypothetical protein
VTETDNDGCCVPLAATGRGGGAGGDGDPVRMAKLTADDADVTGKNRSSFKPAVLVVDNGVVTPFPFVCGGVPGVDELNVKADADVLPPFAPPVGGEVLVLFDAGVIGGNDDTENE